MSYKFQNISVSFLVLTFGAIFSWIAPYSYAQGSGYEGNISNHAGLDPQLEKELKAAGINTKPFSRETYNFIDGDFELSGKIIKAIKQDKLFKNNDMMRENLKVMVAESPAAFFSPWGFNSSAVLTTKNNNSYLKLSQDSSPPSIGQDIKFKSARATIEFDLYQIKISRGSVLEVNISDPYSSADSGFQKEINLAGYILSQNTGFKGFSLDLSQNQDFVDLFNKSPGGLFRVTFLLLSKTGSGAVVGFDNITVIY